MSKILLSAVLTFSSLLLLNPALAQNDYRSTTRSIEQEYLNQNNGQEISDAQLGYYLDKYDAGWTMEQIRRDIAISTLQTSNNAGNPWRPQPGWTAQEIVCTSDNSKYRECPLPFRGRAFITQRISSSACTEGQSWGQRQDILWVNKGCRARFGISPDKVSNYTEDSHTLVCRSYNGKYRQCNTGFKGRVQLLTKLDGSAACIAGKTWGQRDGKVWVTRNCRAQFRPVNSYAGNDDNYNNNNGIFNDRNWQGDANYAVTCSSESNAMARCNWDGRYGQPRLVQQLSQTACIEGRTWGYDNNNSLWVTGGCRARYAR